MRQIAILYSGGTDSTAVTVMMAKEFDKVHLLTFKRFGLFDIDNSTLNPVLLRKKFGEDKFVHRFLGVDKLFKEISYAGYGYNLKKYGFFLLSTCGLCKLAMHIRTLVYCLEHGIDKVACGANKNMSYFPDQMPEYIEQMKKIYNRYGINYSTPVYNFDNQTEDSDWFYKLGLRNGQQIFKTGNGCECKRLTTYGLLFDEGIVDVRNIKATDREKRMQQRCFQLILFNIFCLWYYLPAYGFKRYQNMVAEFYGEKIGYFSGYIDEYLKNKEKSKLYGLLD